MNKEKKIKIFLGITYIVLIAVFLWVFFLNFSISEITSYNFIKDNNQYFNLFKEKNFFVVSIIFFIILYCLDSFWRICFTSINCSWIYFWKMDWIYLRHNRFNYWGNITLYICKLFFKKFNREKILKKI